MTSPTSLNAMTAASYWTHAVKDIWEKKVIFNKYHESFFDKFKGSEGSDMPVIKKEEFGKEALGSIHFTTMNRIYNAGVTAESELSGNEPTTATNRFSLTVNWVRNALAYTKPLSKKSFIDQVSTSNLQLSDWFAWKNDCAIFDAILGAAGADVFYANGKTSSATLTSDDTFLTPDVDKGRLLMDRKKADPFKVKTKNGTVVKYYGCVMSEIDSYNLILSNRFQGFMRDAWERGETNPIFTSVWRGFSYNGMLMYVHSGISGKLGTPLRPEAKLYGTHASDATTITVGANDKNQYTRNFPSSGTLCITGATGVKEFVTYTGKTDYTFTTCTRGATYGEVASSGVEYKGSTQLVTLYNNRSSQIFFGANCVMEGWGQPMTATKQFEDYNFKWGYGIEALYGHVAVADYEGKFPNFIICHSYAANPSYSI